MDESFDRAWRRVGLALDRVGFTVEDRDRSKGVYFVRYIDPEIDNASKQDEGIFSKLAFWRSKKDQTSPQLQIVVNEAGEKSRVSVTRCRRQAGRRRHADPHPQPAAQRTEVMRDRPDAVCQSGQRQRRQRPGGRGRRAPGC